MSMSAEKYSDPTNRVKISKMNKEKGIKEILASTNVDKINKKVSVKCLYEEDKLTNLGENYFKATKRAATLHKKIYPKPEVAGEMDLYIKEQVDNDNYIPFDLKEACQEKHQLHIVGYNFLDSSTSMSTKVKMTTDSSMKTDRGLSLNKVTKQTFLIV